MEVNEKERTKPELDELEVLIKLLKASNPKVKRLNYKDLAELLTKVFNVEVDKTDIYLLYEPSIQNDIIDSETLYGNLLNYSPVILNYEQNA